VITIAGIIVLLVQVKGHPGAWYFAPGLFLIGVGLGVMLTPSVNIVRSAFPENLQGEISGLSRSVSNLGSSFGTAIAGTILVAGVADASRSYGIAMIVLALLGLIGLGATILLPPNPHREPTSRLRPPNTASERAAAAAADRSAKRRLFQSSPLVTAVLLLPPRREQPGDRRCCADGDCCSPARWRRVWAWP
jgi:MFS family permease